MTLYFSSTGIRQLLFLLLFLVLLGQKRVSSMSGNGSGVFLQIWCLCSNVISAEEGTAGIGGGISPARESAVPEESLPSILEEAPSPSSSSFSAEPVPLHVAQQGRPPLRVRGKQTHARGWRTGCMFLREYLRILRGATRCAHSYLGIDDVSKYSDGGSCMGFPCSAPSPPPSSGALWLRNVLVLWGATLQV